MKEALFWESSTDGKVMCSLCPHFCCIKDGGTGVCGVRANIKGKLFSLIYAKASSIAVDPIEKKPLFHFYPGSLVYSMGTLGCNMKCGHCQNWHISHVLLKGAQSDKLLSLREISPQEAVNEAKANGCAGIAWTYNEPTIWFEYTLDCAMLAKKYGLYTVYVTNGYINPEPLRMIGPYLDAFRVDIKGFSDEFCRKVAKVPSIKPVLESAAMAKKELGLHVEVVTNIIPGMNDDDRSLKGLASWISRELGDDTPWHITRFMPCLEFSDVPPTPEATLERARRIGLEAGLKFIYIGNVQGNDHENTCCPGCGKDVIERNGYMIIRNETSSGKCKDCGAGLNIRS